MRRFIMNSYHFVVFLIYLFCYIQLAPAFQQPSLKQLKSSSALEKVKRDLNLHESVPKLARTKRFFLAAVIAIVTGFIGSLAATVIGDQINRAINKETGSSPPPEQKITIINNVINNNYNVALHLKEAVSRRNGNAGNAIRVTPRKWQCDASFCRHVGDGLNTIGVCSPYICHCSNGQPIQQECGTGTVFDPLYKVCNWPYNLKICGN